MKLTTLTGKARKVGKEQGYAVKLNSCLQRVEVTVSREHKMELTLVEDEQIKVVTRKVGAGVTVAYVKTLEEALEAAGVEA